MTVPRTVRPGRPRLALAALACVALATGACSTGGAGGSKPPQIKLDTSHPYGGDPATEGTPQNGGTLKVGMYSDARSFDPTNASSAAASAVYDQLLKFDEKGVPQPFLAKSMTSPDDGKTWVLALRDGVKFQDGTPLDAAAVVFNVKRQKDAITAKGHAFTTTIGSMTATTPLTVTFHISKPNGLFASAFALSFQQGSLGSIASPTAVQKWGKDYGRHPVGAGPFSFVEWVPDSKIVVKKNPNYWQKGLPHLDGIQFVPLSDTETRYASVANGDVDMIYSGYHIEVYRSSQDKNLATYLGAGGGAQLLYLNLTKPPFNDKRMREAVIRAIDPKATSATQFKGLMDEAKSAFPPGSPFNSKAADAEYPTYDPAKAKALVESYKKDGGDPSFTLKGANAPNNVQFDTYTQAQLAAVGITMKLDLFDLAKYIEVLQSGDYQAGPSTDGPWGTAFPYLYNMLHTGGTTNWSHYSNPEVDKALDAAASTTDLTVQQTNFQKAQEIANKDLVILWFSRAYKATIARTYVKGIQRYLEGETFYATVWMAKK